jgi:hypothetical protein
LITTEPTIITCFGVLVPTCSSILVQSRPNLRSIDRWGMRIISIVTSWFS